MSEDGTLQVLVVEDEAVNQKLFANMLERRMGATVTVCPNVEAGLQTFQQNPGKFHMILSDQDTMSDMSGTDLYDAVRKVDPTLPFSILSGKGLDREISDPNFLFAQKPPKWPALIPMLQGLISSTQKMQR